MFSYPCEYSVLFRYGKDAEIAYTEETSKRMWLEEVESVKFSVQEKNDLIKHIVNDNGTVIDFAKNC